MPEATAIKPVSLSPDQTEPPKEKWVTYNDRRQIDFQKSVQQKLAVAGIKDHDPVPIKNKNPLPGFVPGGDTQVTDSGVSKDVPDTFKTGSKLANVSHFTPQFIDDLTENVDSAPIRTGSAREVVNIQDYRRSQVQERNNQGRQKKGGFFSAAKNWFFDNGSQQKGSKVIDAASRFSAQKENKKAA